MEPGGTVVSALQFKNCLDTWVTRVLALSRFDRSRTVVKNNYNYNYNDNFTLRKIALPLQKVPAYSYTDMSWQPKDRNLEFSLALTNTVAHDRLPDR